MKLKRAMTGCAVALSTTLGTLGAAGAQELQCEHNGLPIYVDLKEGMMFVRDSVWLGQDHPEVLPTGVWDTKEEGNHITAEFKVYPRNKIGAGTYEVQFKFDFWKRESYVWVDMKAGYDTYHEIFYCKFRTKPVVMVPPDTPKQTVPDSTAYLYSPTPTYTAPSAPAASAPPAVSYTPRRAWDSYVSSTGRYIHRNLLVGSDGTYKVVATDHDMAGNSNGGSVCIFNAGGWSDCVSNAGDRYQLKPASIRWFVNIANGQQP